MSHAATLDLNHGHLPDRETLDRGEVRGGKRSALDDAKMELPNDRMWVPITFALLAVMAIISSALVVWAVYKM